MLAPQQEEEVQEGWQGELEVEHLPGGEGQLGEAGEGELLPLAP